MIKRKYIHSLNATSDYANAVFNGEDVVYKISATIQAGSSSSFGLELGACENRNEVYNIVFDLKKHQIRTE